MKKESQKGALLVEVIAVLGLIALITPILFSQIQRRNEEIIDAQIASEFRAVKDALSAYIQTNEDIFAEECDLVGADGSFISNDNENNDRICQNAHETASDAANFFAGDPGILDEYDVKWYGRTVPSSGETDYRPIIYAIAYKSEPEPNLRRATKIAAMVGVEGGVAVVNEDGDIVVKGMNGVWVKEIAGIQKNTVAVTTSFDATTNSAILKDATFSNIQAPGSIQAGGSMVATEGMAVGDILSVGDMNCITDYMSDSVTIVKSGYSYTEGTGDSERTITCAPVFEVDPTTKEVHVAGVIKSIACEQYTNSSDCTNNHCDWDTSNNKCVDNYKLDLKDTSRMYDIELVSLGGAKLSDILPKWSLMKVEDTDDSDIKVNDFDCPTNYNRAIVVVPGSINKAGTKTLTISGNGTGSVSVSNMETGDRIVVHKYCVYVTP